MFIFCPLSMELAKVCRKTFDFCLPADLLSVNENDCSFLLKPLRAQEVGHMDMQHLGQCITLHTSNLFIPIHLNIISAFSQHKNIAACNLLPIICRIVYKTHLKAIDDLICVLYSFRVKI